MKLWDQMLIAAVRAVNRISLGKPTAQVAVKMERFASLLQQIWQGSEIHWSKIAKANKTEKVVRFQGTGLRILDAAKMRQLAQQVSQQHALAEDIARTEKKLLQAYHTALSTTTSSDAERNDDKNSNPAPPASNKINEELGHSLAAYKQQLLGEREYQVELVVDPAVSFGELDFNLLELIQQQRVQLRAVYQDEQGNEQLASQEELQQLGQTLAIYCNFSRDSKLHVQDRVDSPQLAVGSNWLINGFNRYIRGKSTGTGHQAIDGAAHELLKNQQLQTELAQLAAESDNPNLIKHYLQQQQAAAEFSLLEQQAQLAELQAKKRTHEQRLRQFWKQFLRWALVIVVLLLVIVAARVLLGIIQGALDGLFRGLSEKLANVAQSITLTIATAHSPLLRAWHFIASPIINWCSRLLSNPFTWLVGGALVGVGAKTVLDYHQERIQLLEGEITATKENIQNVTVQKQQLEQQLEDFNQLEQLLQDKPEAVAQQATANEATPTPTPTSSTTLDLSGHALNRPVITEYSFLKLLENPQLETLRMQHCDLQPEQLLRLLTLVSQQHATLQNIDMTQNPQLAAALYSHEPQMAVWWQQVTHLVEDNLYLCQLALDFTVPTSNDTESNTASLEPIDYTNWLQNLDASLHMPAMQFYQQLALNRVINSQQLGVLTPQELQLFFKNDRAAALQATKNRIAANYQLQDATWFLNRAQQARQLVHPNAPETTTEAAEDKAISQELDRVAQRNLLFQQFCTAVQQQAKPNVEQFIRDYLALGLTLDEFKGFLHCPSITHQQRKQAKEYLANQLGEHNQIVLFYDSDQHGFIAPVVELYEYCDKELDIEMDWSAKEHSVELQRVINQRLLDHVSKQADQITNQEEMSQLLQQLRSWPADIKDNCIRKLLSQQTARWIKKYSINSLLHLLAMTTAPTLQKQLLTEVIDNCYETDGFNLFKSVSTSASTVSASKAAFIAILGEAVQAMAQIEPGNLLAAENLIAAAGTSGSQAAAVTTGGTLYQILSKTLSAKDRKSMFARQSTAVNFSRFDLLVTLYRLRDCPQAPTTLRSKITDYLAEFSSNRTNVQTANNLIDMKQLKVDLEWQLAAQSLAYILNHPESLQIEIKSLQQLINKLRDASQNNKLEQFNTLPVIAQYCIPIPSELIQTLVGLELAPVGSDDRQSTTKTDKALQANSSSPRWPNDFENQLLQRLVALSGQTLSQQVTEPVKQYRQIIVATEELIKTIKLYQLQLQTGTDNQPPAALNDSTAKSDQTLVTPMQVILTSFATLFPTTYQNQIGKLMVDALQASTQTATVGQILGYLKANLTQDERLHLTPSVSTSGDRPTEHSGCQCPSDSNENSGELNPVQLFCTIQQLAAVYHQSAKNLTAQQFLAILAPLNATQAMLILNDPKAWNQTVINNCIQRQPLEFLDWLTRLTEGARMAVLYKFFLGFTKQPKQQDEQQAYTKAQLFSCLVAGLQQLGGIHSQARLISRTGGLLTLLTTQLQTQWSYFNRQYYFTNSLEQFIKQCQNDAFTSNIKDLKKLLKEINHDDPQQQQQLEAFIKLPNIQYSAALCKQQLARRAKTREANSVAVATQDQSQQQLQLRQQQEQQQQQEQS